MQLALTLAKPLTKGLSLVLTIGKISFRLRMSVQHGDTPDSAERPIKQIRAVFCWQKPPNECAVGAAANNAACALLL